MLQRLCTQTRVLVKAQTEDVPNFSRQHRPTCPDNDSRRVTDHHVGTQDTQVNTDGNICAVKNNSQHNPTLTANTVSIGSRVPVFTDEVGSDPITIKCLALISQSYRTVDKPSKFCNNCGRYIPLCYTVANFVKLYIHRGTVNACLVCQSRAVSQCCVSPPVLGRLPSAAASAPAEQSHSRCSPGHRHTTDLTTDTHYVRQTPHWNTAPYTQPAIDMWRIYTAEQSQCSLRCCNTMDLMTDTHTS